MLEDQTDPILLNLALNLSLEFGAQWRQSVADRLLVRRPELSKAEAELLSESVALARDWAHGVVASSVLDHTQTEAQARRQIKDQYPWIDDPTLERTWNQGCYYAMKR